ncbi:MAG: hypothetical protein M1831_000394 [Alyxoria varia]|nr:MAG: hypothetical protein M1831_000394 [Alyxoria varia]
MFKKPKRIPRKIVQDDNGEPISAGIDSQDSSPSVVKRPSNQSKSKKPSSALKHTTLATEDDESTDSAKIPYRKPRNPALSRHALERTAELNPRPGSGLNGLPRRRSSDASDDPHPTYNAHYLAELKHATPTAPALSNDQISYDEDLDLAVNNDVPQTEPPGEATPQSRLNNTDVDIASKFGASATALTTSQPAPPATTSIPSDAQIREKKERRRRLAREQDFISLNDDDNDDQEQQRRSDVDSEDDELQDPRTRSLVQKAERVDLKKAKYGESRLEQSDEDVAEGFEDFVEDAGRVALGRAGRKEQERRRRKEIEERIKEAQRSGPNKHNRANAAGSDDEQLPDAPLKAGVRDIEVEGGGEDEEEDPEDASLTAAYETAQTHAGTYISRSTALRSSQSAAHKDLEARHAARMQALTAAQTRRRNVPSVRDVMRRVQGRIEERKQEIREKEGLLEGLAKERLEIVEEEGRIKILLEEAGERFERARREVEGEKEKQKEKLDTEMEDVRGERPEANGGSAVASSGEPAAPCHPQSAGHNEQAEYEDDEDDDSSEDERPVLGLGAGTRTSGLGMGSGLGAPGAGIGTGIGFGRGLGFQRDKS